MAEKKKLTLSICTSGCRLKAGLAVSGGRGGKFYALSLKEPRQEKQLFPAIDSLLKKAGGGLPDIAEVFAVRGPGRFTGIRIGLTLAGSLSMLLGCRAAGVTVFEVLALSAASLLPRGGKIAVLLHAFKEEYFIQFFQTGGRGAPRPVAAPVWLPEAEARELLAASAPDLCVADEEEKPEIYSLAPENCARAPLRLSRVTPQAVMAAGKIYGGPLTPLYLKPAKYELGKQSKKPKEGKTAAKKRTA